MRHTQLSPQPRTRGGLTLIEVVATLFILATIAALAVPAVLDTPRKSEQLACMNNLRNLTLAVHSYAAASNGTLPLLAAQVPGTDLQVSWAVTLMPLLDNATVLDYVGQQPPGGQAEALSQVLDNTYKVYTCPDDPNHFGKRAGLSYAANIGYGNFRVSPGTSPAIEMAVGGLNAEGLHAADNYSWSGANLASKADKIVSRATGVFWLADADGYRMTIDGISNADGTSDTVLLTENLNSGSLNTWVGGAVGGAVDPRSVGFGLGIADLGLSGRQEDPKRSLEPRTLGPNVQKYWRINANRRALIGRYPVPSSMHPGIVNMSFCDGSAKVLSEKVDLRIYSSILTPQGVRYGERPFGCGGM